jgi:VWFA-related protein
MQRAVNRVGLRLADDAGLEPDQVFPATADPISGPTDAIAAAIADLLSTSWISELHDVYQTSVRELAAIRNLVQAQGAIPGRKVILLFSAGLPVHPATAELLNSSISAANRANVTIYAMDTRTYSGSDLATGRRLLAASGRASMRQMMGAVHGGDQAVTPDQAMAFDMAQASVYANTRGNLAVLAEGTGGALLPSLRDLREPLQRAMEEVRVHYELSYTPSNTETDGRFRKIEVKVSRPGVAVFARSGYFALPLVDGRQVYPFELATLKALNTKPLPRQFDFHAAALRFRPGADRTQFSFAVEAPTRGLTVVEGKEWASVHLAITALVKDEDGQVVDKISKDVHYQVPEARAAELRRGVVSFTAPFLLPPGRYTVETAAVDRESMKASVRRSLLVVDQTSGLSMSDLTLVRRVDTLEGPGSAADPLETMGGKVVPELSDSVAPGSEASLQFYAIAYPPAPVDAPVEMSLEIVRDGQTVARSPATAVPPKRGGAAPFLASVPLEKLPPGHYEAQVTFRYKGEAVTKETAFTVEPEK